MKIAFTTKGPDWNAMMDPRFGRSRFFLIYDEEKDVFKYFDNSTIENEAHGAGPKTAQKLYNHGAKVILTGNGPGGNAARVLEKAGIDIYVGAGDMNVKEAYHAYKSDSLKKF
ncbi:MAG: NifB/NifX family molybdenum-iron cluster-binding protein [Bacteroidota bacterium]|nr:NifB/NifX family molybdenum-iron cluster-binding protein [Bacteroidota bacterium]